MEIILGSRTIEKQAADWTWPQVYTGSFCLAQLYLAYLFIGKRCRVSPRQWGGSLAPGPFTVQKPRSPVFKPISAPWKEGLLPQEPLTLPESQFFSL